MKRILSCLVLIFSLLASHAGTWMPLNSPEPQKAGIHLVSSNITSSVIEFQIPGFYLEPVQTPRGTENIVEVGNSSRILLAGAPDLPKLTASVIIPDEAMMGIRILSSSYTDYSGIEVAPSKGNFTRDIDPASIPYTYGPEYQTNRFFPQSEAELRDPFILRDFRGQTIVVYPFFYNPVTKILRVYSQLTIEVYKIGDQGLNPFIRKTPQIKIQQEFSNVYEKYFLNYNPTDYTPLADFGKMLVICYPDFMASMQPYVDWKNSIGIPTEMVNVSTIGNTSAAIKNYIVNYYNTNTLTFVLLVGDGPQIPTNTGSGLGGPSDNAYGYIVGNDHYIDVFIGRFSAENVAHVQTQVTRTLEYEKYPSFINDDWYTTCLGIASDQGPGDDGEYDYQHMRNMQTDLLGYTYTWNPELFDGSQGGNDAPGNPTPAMVSTEVNNGTSIILYTGHGSTTSWVTSGFSNTNVNQLTNMGKLPFIWAVACVNGDFMNNTCFAEAWLRATQNNQPTGAIAYLGSTINQSWDPPMEGQDEMVDILVETYPNNIRRTFAGLSLNGCSKMIDTYGTAGSEMADTWTVFGDPTLMVRTANPQPLSASFNPTIFVGASTFTVNCNVNGARVTLSNDGAILNTAWVSNGSATLNFPALLVPNDTLTLTVIEYNYIPFIAQIPVIPAEGPYVIYENSLVADSIMGNDNGLLDYAETSNLTIAVKNIGVDSSVNTWISLRTLSPYVTITDSTENYGIISPGQIISVDEGFQLSISSTVPDYQIIPFTLIVQDSSNSWTSQFSLQAHAPVLQQGVISVNDSIGNNNQRLDAGETVYVNIPIINNGSSAAYTLIGTLTTSDPYLIISTPEATYGDILPLSSQSQAYMISAMPNTPAGYQAMITLSLVGDYDLTASFDFTLTIDRIPVLVLDLDGNHNSGPSMQNALNQLNVVNEYTTSFPTDLSKYKSLFVCLGVYPDKHILSAAEGIVLKTYLNQGGRIYMEGGDTWYYDQQSYPTVVHPMFQIKGLKDNGGTLTTIAGKTGTFTEGMSFIYNGDNNYIDKIEPQNQAFTIFNNTSPSYIVTIANDPGSVYKTIGSSNEFGGLTDNVSPSTKKDLMLQYLTFFDIFGSPYWANFVGIPTTIEINDTVKFYDLSSTAFTSRIWSFPGGEPSTSTEANPEVVYSSMGTYNVTLEVSSPDSTIIITRNDYISVYDHTGINPQSVSTEITLYPNPLNRGFGSLNIRSLNANIQSIRIFNSIGREVFSEMNYMENTPISLKHLQPGLYLVEIKTEEEILVQKLIIR
jgi:PKD repeat protein